VKINQLAARFMIGLLFNPEMEATYSSETSFDFHCTTRRYTAKDRALHNHRCENVKSCLISEVDD
jgi:hypothetical protein